MQYVIHTMTACLILLFVLQDGVEMNCRWDHRKNNAETLTNYKSPVLARKTCLPSPGELRCALWPTLRSTNSSSGSGQAPTGHGIAFCSLRSWSTTHCLRSPHPQVQVPGSACRMPVSSSARKARLVQRSLNPGKLQLCLQPLP